MSAASGPATEQKFSFFFFVTSFVKEGEGPPSYKVYSAVMCFAVMENNRSKLLILLADITT
jgi:hypothetical protein